MSATRDAASIVHRFITGFLGKGEMDAADETLAPHVQVITGLKPTSPIDGIDEYKATIAAFVDAFPAAPPLQIIDQFTSDDGLRVVTRFHARLRHTKPFFGVAATDRVILFDETHVTRIEHGRITENIVSATNLEFEMLMAPVLSPMILKKEG